MPSSCHPARWSYFSGTFCDTRGTLSLTISTSIDQYPSSIQMYPCNSRCTHVVPALKQPGTVEETTQKNVVLTWVMGGRSNQRQHHHLPPHLFPLPPSSFLHHSTATQQLDRIDPLCRILFVVVSRSLTTNPPLLRPTTYASHFPFSHRARFHRLSIAPVPLRIRASLSRLAGICPSPSFLHYAETKKPHVLAAHLRSACNQRIQRIRLHP